jgi:pyridoxal phosphate enzyme (YggS family)
VFHLFAEASPDLVKVNLRVVRARIDRASHDAGRQPAETQLVCVSKNFGIDSLQGALEAGQRVFGENRVQEAEEKWTALRPRYPEIELHLIGPLQSNKAEAAVELFDVIETVDRPKIARAIASAMQRQGKKPRLFVQVNVGAEPQKAGVAPADLGDLLELCRNQLELDIEGLMCIPPVDQLVSPHFALLRRLADEFGLRNLSMGMSDDFELAIQLGASYVRVGSAIFGARGRAEASPIQT